MMYDKIKAEIIGLHKWFTQWFNGLIEPEHDDLSRFTTVINEDFYLISPNGQIITQNEIIEIIKQSKGSKSPEMNFKIDIENIIIRHKGPDYYLVTYNEIQHENGVKSNRISSVLFKVKQDNINSLEWVYVHETWT